MGFSAAHSTGSNATHTGTTAPVEKHYRIKDLREFLPLSDRSLRRLFYNEPGIVVLARDARSRRSYRTVLVPESVVRRVVFRLRSNSRGERSL